MEDMNIERQSLNKVDIEYLDEKPILILNNFVKIEEEIQNPKNESFNNLKIILLVLSSSTGFFFFGYNLAVFNTMQENLSSILNWDSESKTVYISIISAICPFGAIIGSILSGPLVRSLGRRKSFFLFDLIGIFSTCLSCAANTYVIIIARLITGYCVGSFSMLVPLYVNEYVPVITTGMYGMLINLMFGIGIFLSFLFGLNLPPAEDVNNNWWRFMFVFSAIPCVINIIVLILFFKYDTPEYSYHFKEDEPAAIKALSIIYKDKKVIDEQIELLKRVKSHNKSNELGLKEICCGTFSKRLIICVFLNIFQQTTLINPVGIYSNLIFMKYLDKSTATLFSVMIGLAEVIGLISAMFVIEKLGRKTLYIFGLTLAFLMFLTMSVLNFYNIVFVDKYVIVFFYFICGTSIDPIIWIYNADVLPDKGVSILTMTNWTTAVILVLIFPFLIESSLGIKGTYLIFSLITCLGCIFAITFMKETKGRNKIQIEEEFKKG